MRAVSLSELDDAAALRRRTDRKYIVPMPVLERLIARLAREFAALEIGGQRFFTYRNVYFDSPSLHTYRAHVQRRRRRYKVRSRHYVDTDFRVLEVKLKGPRGQTVKRRAKVETGSRDPCVEAETFLNAVLREEYGIEFNEKLAPTLSVDYRRATLVAPDGAQRVTLDFDLSYALSPTRVARIQPHWAIVETKSRRFSLGHADRELHSLGARPVSPLSKYLLGVALTVPDARGSNDFKRLLRRHFESPPR